jgi:hypothetical protein
VGALVSVNDFSIRAARVLTGEETLPTGRRRFRFMPTPHVRHGWDAGVLFEESERTLLCSDLFHRWGHRERQLPAASWNGVEAHCLKPKLVRMPLRALHAPYWRARNIS